MRADYRKINEPEKINCQTFVHLYYRDELGIHLPIGMWSKELYEDTDFFKDKIGGDINPVPFEQVESLALQKGDVFFFGSDHLVEKCFDPKKLHVSVYTGREASEGSPLLVHCNYIDKGVGFWDLHDFSVSSRYQHLFGVRQLKPEYVRFLA